MESAFGVEHGDVSKGIPQGLIAAAGKGNKYASRRLTAHTAGSAARANPGEKSPFGGSTHMQAGKWAKQGAKKELAMKNPRKLGYRGSQTSRINRST